MKKPKVKKPIVQILKNTKDLNMFFRNPFIINTFPEKRGDYEKAWNTWRFKFAWYPIKCVVFRTEKRVLNEWVWWEYVLTNGKEYRSINSYPKLKFPKFPRIPTSMSIFIDSE